MSQDNSKTNKLSLQTFKERFAKERKYLWLFFLLFFILIYGYMAYKISNFNSAKPTSFQVSNDLKTTALPTINPNVVNQLEQMQNNSVSVQSLFNSARTNPF